jgi:hypothetical protein
LAALVSAFLIARLPATEAFWENGLKTTTTLLQAWPPTDIREL